MRLSVNLTAETEARVFEYALASNSQSTPDTIRELVELGLTVIDKQKPESRRLETLRAQVRVLVAIGWHDVYIAELLNVSTRYVEAIRRDMEYGIPIKTARSPALFTQARRTPKP